MKKIFLFCIIITLISWPCWAKDTVDIKGWNNTKWGMTENDIIKIFKGQIIDTHNRKINNDTYSNLKLAKYNIDGIDFDVYFEMSKEGDKLRSVRLVDESGLSSNVSKYEQLLTEQYGKSKSKNDSYSPNGHYKKTESWIFPSTKIELIFHNTHGIGSVFNVLYSDQNKFHDGQNNFLAILGLLLQGSSKLHIK